MKTLPIEPAYALPVCSEESRWLKELLELAFLERGYNVLFRG